LWVIDNITKEGVVGITHKAYFPITVM